MEAVLDASHPLHRYLAGAFHRGLYPEKPLLSVGPAPSSHHHHHSTLLASFLPTTSTSHLPSLSLYPLNTLESLDDAFSVNMPGASDDLLMEHIPLNDNKEMRNDVDNHDAVDEAVWAPAARWAIQVCPSTVSVHIATSHFSQLISLSAAAEYRCPPRIRLHVRHPSHGVLRTLQICGDIIVTPRHLAGTSIRCSLQRVSLPHTAHHTYSCIRSTITL